MEMLLLSCSISLWIVCESANSACFDHLACAPYYSFCNARNDGKKGRGSLIGWMAWTPERLWVIVRKSCACSIARYDNVCELLIV